jgi:hypothetical protein
VLAAFAPAADAERCAIQIQQTAGKPVGNVRFEIRVGILGMTEWIKRAKDATDVSLGLSE